MLEKYGLKVSTLNIAIVKDELGLEKQFSYKEGGTLPATHEVKDAQGCVQAQQGEDCICDERLEQVQGVKVFHGLVQGDCRRSDGGQAAAVRGVRSDWQVNRGVRPKGRAAASVMELVNTVREAAGFEEE